jgi:hypothetical protein
LVGKKPFLSECSDLLTNFRIDLPDFKALY